MARGITPFVARQTDPGELGRRLRKARKERNLSQTELAERANLDQTTVSKIERGERVDPSLSTIAALERVLNMSLGVTVLHPSLQRFLASPQGALLHLQQTEIDELASQLWWGSLTADPTDDEWYDYVRLRRSVQSRGGRQPT